MRNVFYTDIEHDTGLTRVSVMAQVELEGLTGEVRFNDDGRRQNYTLHVVEMTVNSAMVKVGQF